MEASLNNLHDGAATSARKRIQAKLPVSLTKTKVLMMKLGFWLMIGSALTGPVWATQLFDSSVIVGFQALIKVVSGVNVEEVVIVKSAAILGLAVGGWITLILFKSVIVTIEIAIQLLVLCLSFACTVFKGERDLEAGIPFPAYVLLASLGKRNYSEILGDLAESYPIWLKQFGSSRASLLCYVWIGSCIKGRIFERLNSIASPRKRTAR